MTFQLSQNTQAILLLTAPLIMGRGADSARLLAPREYKQLTRCLREARLEPADMLTTRSEEVLETCSHLFDSSRLKRLLDRGFLLSQVVEDWRSRSIWVVSRADSSYPKRLKARLKEDSPPVIYGCGRMEILDSGGLAVVGSRKIEDSTAAYSAKIGQLAASAARTVISGGAKGVDITAMRGALNQGGAVIGVLAEGLARAAIERSNRESLLDGRLCLISPFDPRAGFNIGNTMQRNKFIYALADAALVVNSDINKGGTWSGAVEQLNKLRLVPVFVRSTGAASPGLDALVKRGALLWPNPQNPEELEGLLKGALLLSDPDASSSPKLQFDTRQHEAPEAGTTSPVKTLPIGASSLVSKADPVSQSEAGLLFDAVRSAVLRLLTSPKTDAEIAAALDVSKAQAKTWMSRLVAEGQVQKQRRPAGYTISDHTLFDGD